MSEEKEVEEAIVGSFNEPTDQHEEKDASRSVFSVKNLLWHGGSVYDAWFSCASNQVAQVLLTLPYSFSQMGMLSGIILQIFYGVLGRLAFNCTFLLFGTVIQLIACASNIYYINDKLDKRTWTYIFGACCATTVFIPSFHNYRIWSFLGLGMTTYTAWYLTIASFIHGQVEGVTHQGPTKLVLYFTGATNILYTFGGHAVTVVLKGQFFITFGFACTPLYFVWEKVVGIHDTKSICLRAACRLPVVIPIWFLAIIFPFFGPINSAVGSLLVSFTVYIIPALAHMLTYKSASARRNAAEKPPFFLPSWTAVYAVNAFIVIWVFIVGFGLGGWASMTNFIRQVDTFGLFAKCYQCPPTPSSKHH
ncbi:Auxin transporter-like protein 2 [Gossypium arboreum]|uniref:Auxin transporter-like protein 2 n=1 Tax=Gossypium arboreum TaxID=29729 RepID=A0A0B0N5X3_GOSAR|nr:Auxin transporter-like protein 2 [Gossypium arboreum]